MASRPAQTRAVALAFGLSAEGFNQLIQKPKSNSRGEERMGSKWSNMQARPKGALYRLADYETKPDQRTTGTPLFLLKLRLLMQLPWRPWEASHQPLLLSGGRPDSTLLVFVPQKGVE